MALKQVNTITGDLQMVEVNEGILPIVSVRILRHAGDHDDGVENSWFPEITVRAKGHEGGTIHLVFTHKKTATHGWTKAKAGCMCGRILIAGEINLKHWNWSR